MVNKRPMLENFDFDHSGILKNDAGVCLEDEWEIEPEEAIKYRTIKKRRQTARSQITKKQIPISKSKQKEKLF